MALTAGATNVGRIPGDEWTPCGYYGEDSQKWCSSPAGKAAMGEHHDERGKIDPRQGP
jgi:hypothetical protein